MGYWGIHPMAGDTPSDVKYLVDDLLFTENEQEQDLTYDQHLYKQRLAEKLNEATTLDFTREGVKFHFSRVETTPDGVLLHDYEETRFLEDNSFVLPFLVMEHEIQISDPTLSQKVKSMLRDGGAFARDYPIPKIEEKLYPSVENNWNDLQSPFDYARKAHDLWDMIMDGTLPFTAMEHAEGLFDVIQHYYAKQNQTKPVNLDK